MCLLIKNKEKTEGKEEDESERRMSSCFSKMKKKMQLQASNVGGKENYKSVVTRKINVMMNARRILFNLLEMNIPNQFVNKVQ